MTIFSSTTARYRPPRQLGGNPGRRRAAGVRNAKAVGFLAPSLAIVAVFVVYPAIRSLYLSFTSSTGFSTGEWVGLENYATIFTSDAARRAIVNTAIYAAIYAPAVIVVGLLIALLLNRDDIPLRSLFRTVIFLPFIISMAVASFAWSFLLNPNLGLLTYWLERIGVSIGDVFASPTWALPAVTAVAVWKNFGYFMVIFLAGLQGIPRDLYEAARIDGAGAMRRFFAVTLPGLRNTMTFVIIFALIGAFQAFDQIYIMTQGGPDRATETIVYRIYTDGFRDFRFGLASAFSYLLLLITLVLGLVRLRTAAKHERDLA